MANHGKFKDRFPEIRPAGYISFDPESTVKNALRDSSFEIRLKEEMGLLEKNTKEVIDIDHQNRPLINDGLSNRVVDLVNPPPKTVFESLLDELRETAYPSYWTRPLGQVPDPAAGLPVGFDPISAPPFGAITASDPISGEELINPKKTPFELSQEDKKGHHFYVVSHHDYAPGEQVERKYDNPKLNKELFWGMMTGQRTDGSRARKVLQWFDQSKVKTTSKKQSNHKAHHHHEMGKAFSPNRYLEVLPKDFTFGKSTEGDGFGVSQLLKSSEPNVEAKSFANCLSYINSLRLKLSKRDPPIPFYEIMQEFKHIDPKSCGCLPIQEVYKVLEEYKVPINKKLIELLLKLTNFLQDDGKVNYNGLMRLINSKLQFPSLTQIEDIPKEALFFETTYQDFSKSTKQKGVKDETPAAGLTTLRMDKMFPLRVHTKVDEAYLLGETTADALIRPNIFTLHGISHRDLFWPRSKKYIKELFERVEVSIPEDIFEILWEEGTRREKVGDCVSIETFRNLLDEVTGAKFAQITRKD